MNTIKSFMKILNVHNRSSLIYVQVYRTFKSDLKIKWIRPEKIPSHKPEKSGDLEGVPKQDKSQLQLKFRNVKELETADENVRKLFTLEFAKGSETLRSYLHDLKSKVKRHNYDVASIEVKIARMTGVIRAFQESVEQFPHYTGRRVVLQELIDKRKKCLKHLRTWDYKRYEWLLENLNIVFKAHPPQYHWITRKDSLRKLTNEYCDNIKDERLNAYKLHLKAEQPAFLEEKIRCLEFIRKEQKDCGVAVTVTQEEIDQVREQLGKLRKENEIKEE